MSEKKRKACWCCKGTGSVACKDDPVWDLPVYKRCPVCKGKGWM